MRVGPRRPSERKIRVAAGIIRKGGLVAFPTETVYGLGANALDAEAVNKIYEAKGRPLDNPLIVHIAREDELKSLAREIPAEAEVLIEKFWPGPLTLVLRKREVVPKATTAGLGTVAVRMPSNKIALALISASGVPIAAPSANISEKPSPTKAEHVLRDLNGKIHAIIDGGAATVGVESTVLNLTAPVPTVLRPGGVTFEELQGVLGEVKLHPAVDAEVEAEGKILSPGMKYRHYAPEAELILVEGCSDAVIKRVQELADELRGSGKKVGIMASKESAAEYEADVIEVVGSRGDLTGVARNLFGTLRKLDEEGADVIIAEGFETRDLGLVIVNRLRKAASRREQISGFEANEKE